MILRDVKNYIFERGQVPLREIGLHFEIDPEVIRGILGTLEIKGLIVRLPSGSACSGGCTQCSPESIDIYQWNEH